MYPISLSQKKLKNCNCRPRRTTKLHKNAMSKSYLLRTYSSKPRSQGAKEIDGSDADVYSVYWGRVEIYCICLRSIMVFNLVQKRWNAGKCLASSATSFASDSIRPIVRADFKTKVPRIWDGERISRRDLLQFASRQALSGNVAQPDCQIFITCNILPTNPSRQKLAKRNVSNAIDFYLCLYLRLIAECR